jgi:hypothetical protein
MKNRRLAIAGLALTAALGLTACGTTADETPTSTTSAPGGTPAANAPAAGSDAAAKELVAAAEKLAGDSFKVTSDMGNTLSTKGALDPKGKKAKMTVTLGGGTATKVDIIQLADDMYLKFDGQLSQVVGKGWMHIDATKLKAGSSFNQLQGNDPAGTQAMAKAVTDVEKTGNDFKGTLDLTKTPHYNKDSMKALGAKASAVPFTAKTDAEGRLVSMSVEMEGLMTGAGTMTTTYSDFGTKVDAVKPSGAKELPENMAGLLNA